MESKNLLSLSLALVFSLMFFSASFAQQGFKVIVNEKNEMAQVEKSILAKIFLKKSKSMDDGTQWQPVDHELNSQIAEEFCKVVHGKKPNAISSFWQRMIFSGRDTPPPTMSSDQDVFSHVAGDVGGIGYVSEEAQLPDGVKELKIVE